MKTLFLDRDGVINQRKVGGYISSAAELVYTEKAIEAIRRFSDQFDCIIVVTNQQGIGKEIMSEADLAEVHEKLLYDVEKSGGRIDGIYYCRHLKTLNCNCRKPNTDMALFAKRDFPAIDFSNAWMVGDSYSDIQFGKKMGMQCALVEGKTEEYKLLKNIDVEKKVEGISVLFF